MSWPYLQYDYSMWYFSEEVHLRVQEHEDFRFWQLRFTTTRHVCHSSSLVGFVLFFGVLGCGFVLVVSR